MPWPLWFARFGLFSENQFEKAIQVWQKLAPQLEPDSEDAKTLNESIGAAYARLGKRRPTAKTLQPGWLSWPPRTSILPYSAQRCAVESAGLSSLLGSKACLSASICAFSSG